MEALSQDVRWMIFALWLQGLTRDEIHERTGVSTGAISGVIKDLLWQMGEDAEITRRYALEVRRAGCSVKESMIGFRIVMLLSKIGIRDPDAVEDYLIKLEEATGGKLDDKLEIGKHLMALLELSKKSDVPVDKVPEHVSSQIAQGEQQLVENIRLEQEKSRLMQEISKLKEENERALEDNNTSIEKVKKYDLDRALLLAHGIDIDSDLEQAVRCISNWKDARFDREEMLKNLTTIESVKAETRQLDAEIKAKLEEIYHLDNTLAERVKQLQESDKKQEAIEAESKKKAKVHDAVESLLSKNVTEDHIIRIDRACKKAGMDPEASIMKIVEVGDLNEEKQEAIRIRQEVENKALEAMKKLQQIELDISLKEGHIFALDTENERKQKEIKRLEVVRKGNRALIDLDQRRWEERSATIREIYPAMAVILDSMLGGDAKARLLLEAWAKIGEYVTSKAYDRTIMRLRPDYIQFIERVRRHKENYPELHLAD